jgi:alpha-tubulin suppressor-like RCC1 family protein
MRRHIRLFVMIAVFVSASAPGCSLADEAAPVGAEATAEAQPAEPPAETLLEVAGSPSAEPLVPAHRRASTGECAGSQDCAALPNTAGWCSPDGECLYTCQPGFADANAEVVPDGCECQIRHGGREICDGHDGDCDGVVDNPFAGGKVSAGSQHSCALDRDGALRCWGTMGADVTPQQAGVRLWQVDAGHRHTCGITAAGRLYCFGDNTYGQLGRGDFGQARRPVQVVGDARFVEVAVGRFHTCALTRTRRLMCWGRNDYGQLGDGTDNDRDEPVAVARDVEFASVAAGDFHSCATSAAGEVSCWGANFVGQTGQPRASSVETPSTVAGLPTMQNVVAGANHSCGRTVGGRVYCWGHNESGQLGDDTRQGGARPRSPTDEYAFEALSAGGDHTCALAASGQLYCWGANGSGQLGIDELRADSPRPRPSARRHRFSQVSAGSNHTCAMTTGGHLYCWGAGTDGQLVRDRERSSRLPTRADCP